MNEMQYGPPGEVARHLCPECGSALLASDTVFQDKYGYDVLGCKDCLCWRATQLFGREPGGCPSCGSTAPYDGMQVLVLEDAVEVVIACAECACECTAGEALEEYEPEL